MPVDHARRQGVRRPVVFDYQQERRPTATRFGLHDTNDQVCIVKKLDLVLHLCAARRPPCYAAPPACYIPAIFQVRYASIRRESAGEGPPR